MAVEVDIEEWDLVPFLEGTSVTVEPRSSRHSDTIILDSYYCKYDF